eukprot:gnl/TRDRNA2_/TRDRNA2_110037_c0_seq1.p2 gnl/TRDRNA2_/TRDRNA2_110037_c0~~gnl/TRDRNA2_/TRDRNA2_110037_c0_seq1.p2  ORF type:complete len:119 (-),score=6.86 gnl/TRDRNA2_/TRDRNA2_110037_c0_seq1:99-455(-)
MPSAALSSQAASKLIGSIQVHASTRSSEHFLYRFLAVVCDLTGAPKTEPDACHGHFGCVRWVSSVRGMLAQVVKLHQNEDLCILNVALVAAWFSRFCSTCFLRMSADVSRPPSRDTQR